MILAAVSISAVYNSKIINYATNGAVDYATESVKENEILDKTTSLMESAISNIESINAGNGGTSGSTEEPEQPPVEEPIKGIDFGEMTEEEFTNNYVGKYVAYTPVSGTFSDHVGSTYSGDTQNLNTQLSTDTSLKWKILFADNNKLTLISDKAVHNGFTLEGANGYNNGVLLLNNACKAMYSNNSLGATGRSLKIEDIESVSSFKGTDYTSSYGQEYTPAFKYYPNIFGQEEGGNISENYGSLGRSEQNEYITGHLEAGTLRGKWTSYSYTMTSNYMNQKYVELLNCSLSILIASRCISLDSLTANFYLFTANDNNDVYGSKLYDSNNGTKSLSYAIRPVVEIDLSKVYIGETGSGADGDAYSIVARNSN